MFLNFIAFSCDAKVLPFVRKCQIVTLFYGFILQATDYSPAPTGALAFFYSGVQNKNYYGKREQGSYWMPF